MTCYSDASDQSEISDNDDEFTNDINRLIFKPYHGFENEDMTLEVNELPV